MTKVAKKTGRPSTFTQAKADQICARLSMGEPLAAICRDADMPDPATVWRWQQDRPELAQAIARAREIGFDVIAADCLEIADETGRDTKYGQDGREMPDAEWISRSKLRVDTRLKLLAKWDPKRYGDKVALTGGNPDADEPIQHAVKVELVRPNS